MAGEVKDNKENNIIWFENPEKRWEETLLIGNGKLPE